MPDSFPDAPERHCVAATPLPLPATPEEQRDPVSLTVCTLAVAGAAGSWLVAGYFVQSLQQQQFYQNPTVLAYLAVVSLQVYFVLISVPPAFPSTIDEASATASATATAAAAAEAEAMQVSDVFTNRQTAKLALCLFVPFSVAYWLVMKGLTLFPQSAYCGGLALQGPFAMLFALLPGLRSERVTRYKLGAAALVAVAALLTLAEPALWRGSTWIQYASIGYAMLVSGVGLLALVWCLVARLTEHTSIQLPLIFAFIGLLWMLVGWIGFIPLHVLGIEPLVAFPPDAAVYWHIGGVALLGAIVPVYLLQWALTRTSVVFVSVGLGAIVPLHWVSEAVYRVEWNWVKFGAAVVALGGLVLVNTRYKA